MDQLPPPDSRFGAALIGAILAAILYGVSCAQCFYYFQHYSKKDGRWTKSVVVATMISDTVHQTLISHTVYTYLITYKFQPQKLEATLWSPVVAVIFNGITGLLVQTFYAVRIWKFGQKNMIIAAVLFASIVGGFVFVIVYFAKCIKLTTTAELRTLEAISVTVNALAAVADVLITIVFCFMLHRTRCNLQRSNTMIDLLIVFTVQTGMLTSLCAIAGLASIIASPGSLVFICFSFMLGRLYCNSLLGSLNVRNAIRERGDANIGISLGAIDNLKFSTFDNRKETDIKIGIVGAETNGPITGTGARGGGDSLPSVQSASCTNGSHVVELELGQPHTQERPSGRFPDRT